jgi:micrococcal nuclease
MRLRKTKYLLPALIILLLLFRFYLRQKPAEIPDTQTRIIRVIDGDTVDLTGGKTVRLLGIDCPEKGEPFADSAGAFLSRLALGKVVSLKYSKRKKDNYDRLLAYLYVDSLWLNREILRQGLAGIYLFEDNLPDREIVAQLLAAQTEAMNHHRGIWSIPHKVEDFYLSKKGSLRFHRPSCDMARKFRPGDVVRFATREEALRLGLSPCRNCRP